VFTQLGANSAYLANPIATSGVLPEITARPFADIYGDYNPSPTKSVIPIQTDELVNVTAGELFELPVRVMENIDFSALTLELQYDASKLKVENLTSDMPGLQFVIENNVIRAVWSRIESVHYNYDQNLVKLYMRTLSPVYKSDQVLTMNTKTQFADNSANVISNVPLAAASIANSSTGISQTGSDNFLFEMYPNPFTDIVSLNYTITESANVKITLTGSRGEVIAVLAESMHESGNHSFDYVPRGLASGTYYVKVDVNSKANSFSSVYKLVHVK
jgi:hypothetical protein